MKYYNPLNTQCSNDVWIYNKLSINLHITRSNRDHDRMVVGFTTSPRPDFTKPTKKQKSASGSIKYIIKKRNRNGKKR